MYNTPLRGKKTFNKRELIENDIVEKMDDDYPYVNIFIDLKGQNFWLIPKYSKIIILVVVLWKI